MTIAPLDKDSARRDALAARQELSGHYRIGASRSIADHLMGMETIRAPGRLAIYRATSAEVDLQPHEAELRSLGWRLMLPRTTSETEMEYVDFPEDAELHTGRFRIAEPVGTDVVPAMRIDAIVCPCVALDRRGTRVGFGAGFHDRVLAELPGAAGIDRPYLIGVGFDVQLFDRIQGDPWDVAMDYVITESGVVDTAQAD